LGTPSLVFEALVKDANSKDDIGSSHAIVIGGVPYANGAVVQDGVEMPSKWPMRQYRKVSMANMHCFAIVLATLRQV